MWTLSYIWSWTHSLLQVGMSVKNQNQNGKQCRWDRRHQPSHLDLHWLQRCLFLFTGLKGVNKTYTILMFFNCHSSFMQLPRRRTTQLKRAHNGGTHHISRASMKQAASKMWRRLTQRRKSRRKSAEEPRNSVSKIDKASRVLFPLVFLVFNIMYCVIYYYL